MSTGTSRILQRRRKIEKTVYSLLSLILIAGAGLYSYSSWQEYNTVRGQIEQNKNTVKALQIESSEKSAEYFDEKGDDDELRDVVARQVLSVFPESDNYKELTKLFDAFEESTSRPGSPFEISNISFQAPSDEGTYAVLPVSLSIRSSQENFDKFLHWVENSGTFEEEARLMDLSSIRLSFSGNNDSSEVISFNVQINAYFQN